MRNRTALESDAEIGSFPKSRADLARALWAVVPGQPSLPTSSVLVVADLILRVCWAWRIFCLFVFHVFGWPTARPSDTYP